MILLTLGIIGVIAIWFFSILCLLSHIDLDPGHDPAHAEHDHFNNVSW